MLRLPVDKGVMMVRKQRGGCCAEKIEWLKVLEREGQKIWGVGRYLSKRNTDATAGSQSLLPFRSPWVRKERWTPSFGAGHVRRLDWNLHPVKRTTQAIVLFETWKKPEILHVYV